MAKTNGPLWNLYQDLRGGEITRRQFLTRATALGVGMPVTLFVLSAIEFAGASARPAAPLARPSVGTENQVRGAGGELKLLQREGPRSANAHSSNRTTDLLASSLVQEPLLSHLPDGTLVPNLVTEVPSLDNGGLSEDIRTVTYNLHPGVVWSDGEPLVAGDVVWTWQWIMDVRNAAAYFDRYEAIQVVEAASPTQIKLVFKEPTLAWFVPFSGTYGGQILPKHAWDGQDIVAVNRKFLTQPIGTGPYKIDSFVENDQVTYSINENYREPNKPYFATVTLKGGGVGTLAAKAVLQWGNWDVAANLQVEPEILRGIEEEATTGTVQVSTPTSVEQIRFNFSDPNAGVDGERSSLVAPHPFLTDLAVRQAMGLAIDRDSIANQFYLGGDREYAAVNILTGIPSLESPNTSFEFNIEAANSLLDEAGWVRDGGVRVKDGVELSVEYCTTIDPVRQKTQAVVADGWEQIGINVTTCEVEPGIFFDRSPGNEQSISHFYRDVQMYTNGPESPFPVEYFQNWYTGPDNGNVAQKANQWSGLNSQRYINPEFDALYDEVKTTRDSERAAELFIQMNDIVVIDHVVVPLVARAAKKYAISNRLTNDNIAASAWETLYWNVANWTTASEE